MKPQTVPVENSLTSSMPNQTSTKTGGNIVHPSGRPYSKLNIHLHTNKNESNITTPSGCKKESKVATTRIDSAVYSSKLSSVPIIHHRSGCICSKQTELKVAMITTEPIPDKQAGNCTPLVIRHRSGCICSKQTDSKVATISTDVAPVQQVKDMTTPVVRHHSGCICSKQDKLKVAKNTTKDEKDSKLTGKSTNT